jgi:hypothetical protein
VPTLILTHHVLALYGLAADAIHGRELPPEVVHALSGKLVAEGFDLTVPIHVQELPYGQGFHVTQ